MKNSNFNLEKELLKRGFDFTIGTDEAGRGPLAGPVVAAAVTVRNDQFPMTNDKLWSLVRDSKKLSEKQREKVFDFVQENFHIGIGICDHKTIDRINILEASFLAMKKAVSDLQRKMENKKRSDFSRLKQPEEVNPRLQTKNYKPKTIILVDGNKKIPNFSAEQMAVVGGDKIVKSISAASIIAKVTRDRIMLEMDKIYPRYNFDKHKGYGTKMHIDALSKYGPCEIHRHSFAPVRKAFKKENIDI